MNSDRGIVGDDRDHTAAVDDVVARTRALWPRAAAAAGLPESGAAFRRMQVNSRFELKRCVLRVETSRGDRFILRGDFAGERAGWTDAILDRHMLAAEKLSDVPGVSVPAVLWQDPVYRHQLMEFASGDTAFLALGLTGYGLGDRSAQLERIGSAVAALHGCDGTAQQTFDPAGHLRTIARTAKDVRSGAVALARPKRFLGLCAFLHQIARRAEGRAFPAGLVHGDLHFRNILISPELVSFIDFSRARIAFPYWDIANLWLANGLDHLTRDEKEAGFGHVAKADWLAFEAGYGLKLTEDPVFQFLFTFRLWQSWAGVLQARHITEERQKEKLRLMWRVFEGLRALETG